MRVQNFHLLAELPDLGPPGAPPPLTAAELLSILSDREHLHLGAGRIFLMDDLLAREAHLSGERSEDAGVVLSPAQIRGEAPLPDYLMANQPAGRNGHTTVDGVWAAYFEHVLEAAQQLRIRFLIEWAAFEVAIRNGTAVERARLLGLDARAYLVAPHIGDGGPDVSSAVSAWAAADNPLAGQRALELARWEWLTTHDAWYSFTNDEVVACAAKLQIIIRAYRISEEMAEDLTVTVAALE